MLGITEAIWAGFSRFFGIASAERSYIGEYLSKVRPAKRVKKLAGLALLSLFVFSVFIHNYSFAANIGGVPTINAETPQISVTTKITTHIPVKLLYVSRGFSWYHSGIDLAALYGLPVYPIMDGTVLAANYDWYGYGKHVIIDHGGGFTSLYGHFSEIDVKAGDKVSVDTQIGKVGSTGFSTGPHVHLEIRQDGKLIDPAEILPDIVVANK